MRRSAGSSGVLTPFSGGDLVSQEHITACLWNLSSCSGAKRALVDQCVEPLVNLLLLPHAREAERLTNELLEQEAARTQLENELQTQNNDEQLDPVAASSRAQLVHIDKKLARLRADCDKVWSPLLLYTSGLLRSALPFIPAN